MLSQIELPKSKNNKLLTHIRHSSTLLMRKRSFFLALLKAIQRKQKRRTYSLREFAFELDIDPSTLSKLIRDKRKPTNKTIVRLCLKMKIEKPIILQIIGHKTNSLS